MSRHYLFLIIIQLSTNTSLFGIDSDTTNKLCYVAIAPSFYTTSKNVGERTSLAFEFGRQWDVFSLSITSGKTNFGPSIDADTIGEQLPSGKWYVALRPNLNVFQQKKFTNTLTIGAGYVFHSEQYLINEITTGIEYDFNRLLSLNINFGTYYFTGKKAASNQTFFGCSLNYIIPDRSKYKP